MYSRNRNCTKVFQLLRSSSVLQLITKVSIVDFGFGTKGIIGQVMPANASLPTLFLWLSVSEYMVHPHRPGFMVLSPWELVKRKGGRGTIFKGKIFIWSLHSWQERDPGAHLCWSPSTTLCRLFPHHWWCHQVQKRAQCHPLWRTETFHMIS